MVAGKSDSHDISAQQLRTKFLDMLPRIRTRASVAFRDRQTEAKEELIAEVVANCWCAFVRLANNGKIDRAFATPLANFAIRQVRDGRRVGTKLNVRDVSSSYCQRANNFRVEHLDRFERESETWRQVIVEDRRTGPAETATMRIDFADWLKTLSPKRRRIATTLASGETTGATARKFHLSDGRISQLRRQLRDVWLVFQGELAPTGAAA